MASRGVGPVAAARLGLGYSPGSGLRQALESLDFSEKRIRDSELLMGEERSGSPAWSSFPTPYQVQSRQSAPSSAG